MKAVMITFVSSRGCTTIDNVEMFNTTTEQFKQQVIASVPGVIRDELRALVCGNMDVNEHVMFSQTDLVATCYGEDTHCVAFVVGENKPYTAWVMDMTGEMYRQPTNEELEEVRGQVDPAVLVTSDGCAEQMFMDQVVCDVFVFTPAEETV